jgi:hypothetical protein
VSQEGTQIPPGQQVFTMQKKPLAQSELEVQDGDPAQLELGAQTVPPSAV